MNREGATDARQENVVYSLDADTKEAQWASGAAPTSKWSRSLPRSQLCRSKRRSRGRPVRAARSGPGRRPVPTRRDGLLGTSPEAVLVNRRSAGVRPRAPRRWACGSTPAAQLFVPRLSLAGTCRLTEPMGGGPLGSASTPRRWRASRCDWWWTSTRTVSPSGSPTPLTISVRCPASPHCSGSSARHSRWW